MASGGVCWLVLLPARWIDCCCVAWPVAWRGLQPLKRLLVLLPPAAQDKHTSVMIGMTHTREEIGLDIK